MRQSACLVAHQSRFIAMISSDLKLHDCGQASDSMAVLGLVFGLTVAQLVRFS